MMKLSSIYCLLLFLALSFGPSSTGRDASSFPDTLFVVHATGTLREGHTVTLSCHLDGPSATSFTLPSSYVWVKDGKVIPGQTGVTYNVGPLTKQDKGDYQCGNPDSDLPRGKYQLNVFIPGKNMVPKPTVFQSGLPVAGRPFYLDCVILEGYAANDNTRYTWYKGFKETKEETGPMLRFPSLTEADEGEYECTAMEGPPATTSPPSAAYYLKPLVAPQVYIKPASIDFVVRGVLRENLTLTCEVTRAFPVVPMEGYSWSYLPSNQEQWRPLAEKSSALTLSPLTRSHSGQYQCQARNDHDFPGMELTGRASVAVDVVYLENISVTHDLEVSEGKPLTLTCTVDSHPAAHLTWTVSGKDQRNVTNNLDHYYIPSTSCSDSTNYTCRASNTYIPGQEKTAATHVKVNCIRDPRHQRPQNGVIYSRGSAPLDFFLPKQTVMAIVHPHGQVIITFFPNCSYVISEAFGSRCLHPYCDLEGLHVSFTLAQLTEKDEGNYICMEEGKELPNCIRRLVILEQSADGMPPETKAWVIATVLIPVLLAVAVTTLIIMRRRRIAKCFIPASLGSSQELVSLTTFTPSSTKTLVTEESHSFETLYVQGTVYVIPKLAAPDQQALPANEVESNESAPFLSYSSKHVVEQAEFTVKNLFRHTLQQSTDRDDPPSFLLHNTHLSWLTNVILVLSSKLGVVLITVQPDEDNKKLPVDSLEKAGSQLLKAKSLVCKKLKGIVKSEAITAVLALPNLPDSDMTRLRPHIRIFRAHPDLVLMGQDGARFREWSEHLSRRTLSDVWNLSPGVDSPVTAFKMVASKFLTLTAYSGAEDSQESSTAARSWLLTPPQLKVRDSMAKLLHVSGPPGSGKTRLLICKARRWLAEGKAVVLAVGRERYDALLAHVSKEVLKQQNDETRRRTRICRFHEELALTLQELRGQYPNTEICLAIDTLRDPVLFQNMLEVVQNKQVSAAWSVCRDSLQTINPALAEKAQQLGWESIKLEESVRCTEDTIDLLNKLGENSPTHYKIAALSVPRTRDVPKWKVVDHCLHPDYSTTMLSCDCCKKELSSALYNHDREPSWNDWIALYTGNPNEYPDIKPVCALLQNYGIPASLDSHYEIVASHGTHPDSSETDVANWLERVVAGKDETGQPTVHLVRVRDLAGMEKEVVLLVHWDERDNDPKRQSQLDRDTRLQDHRHLWFLAVSRCKGQVILLLLTPSPARSLLNLQELDTP